MNRTVTQNTLLGYSSTGTNSQTYLQCSLGLIVTCASVRDVHVKCPTETSVAVFFLHLLLVVITRLVPFFPEYKSSFVLFVKLFFYV